MQFIDTHCHIYLEEFDNDREAMLQRAKKEGITKFLMPAIDSSTHSRMFEIGHQNPVKCLNMMGLHPCSVKENYAAELKIIRDYIDKQRFIAIGEIGLDFYWDLSFREQQFEVFNQQIKWALEFDLPIVIHSRNSIDECIEVVRQYQKGKLKGVFHCFSGTEEQANKIIDLGFYLGIGGVLTFKNAGIDKVIEKTDMNFIVLETDAPYLAPVPFRGKRNESAYLKYVAQKLAEIKNISIEEVAALTTANAQKLFGF